jgi:hypothetical protein
MPRFIALPIIALSFAVACDDSTTGPEQGGLGPSFQEGSSDFSCSGLVVDGTFQNVLVPSGESCEMFGSTVRGNVTVFEDADLFMSVFEDEDFNFLPSSVGGNLKALEGAQVEVAEISIEGNFEADKASLVIIHATEVGGNVVIKGSSDFGGEGLPGKIVLSRSEVEGNVQLFENPANSEVELNEFGQNLQVFKNQGVTQIFANTVGGNLQCFDNEPDPITVGNTVSGNTDGECQGP